MKGNLGNVRAARHSSRGRRAARAGRQSGRQTTDRRHPVRTDGRCQTLLVPPCEKLMEAIRLRPLLSAGLAAALSHSFARRATRSSVSLKMQSTTWWDEDLTSKLSREISREEERYQKVSEIIDVPISGSTTLSIFLTVTRLSITGQSKGVGAQRSTGQGMCRSINRAIGIHPVQQHAFLSLGRNWCKIS